MTEEETRVDWSEAGRPCFGERVSGDVVVTEQRGDLFLAALADVVGHGPEAHEEAVHLEHELRTVWDADPVRTLRGLHEGLVGGRGAAVTALSLEIASGRLRYATVGNTSVRIFNEGSCKRGPATSGTIGQAFRSPSAYDATLGPRSVLLVGSDGIDSSFGIEDYPQISYLRARTIANTVLRRFGRTYDDATCLVLRYPT